MEQSPEKPLKRESETISAIDQGYGDSDVYLAESDTGMYVRKVYQPERMLSHLHRNLQPEIFHGPIAAFLGERVSLLQMVTPDHLKTFLEEVISTYAADTLTLAEEVDGNQALSTYSVEDRKGVEKIVFEVVPQGTFIQNAHNQVISEGQEVIPGKNFEQLIGVKEAATRMAPNTGSIYPEAFSDVGFVNSTLNTFGINLLRSILQDKAFTQGRPYPLFTRLHPANVIPAENEGTEWRFKITDLSSCVCLDYALLVSYLEAKLLKENGL